MQWTGISIGREKLDNGEACASPLSGRCAFRLGHNLLRGWFASLKSVL